MSTHEVRNQVPPLADYDVAADPALLAALTREGAGWAEPGVHELGLLAGSARTRELARLANLYPPVLRSHDSRGNRADEVDFHPAWHELMTTAVTHGLHAAPWRDARPGAHVARAAGFYVWTQAEAGHCCPISMTYACVPALRHAPGLAARYEPLLAAPVYQPGLEIPDGKAGLVAGMGMTEKQGGSDVRANTTRAVPLDSAAADTSADARGYLLTGHKWFCSAPMSDMFLVLAQAPEGLSCFLLPRVLPDGTRNAMHIQRLKDKLGNRSNASSEVEYDGALAWLVGEPGRGVVTIIEMVTATRLDCVLGSAAQMRQACVAAAHYVSRRQAFGTTVIGHPAMTAVIADLTLESEAAAVLAMRLAGAADRTARGDGAEADFLRLALPAAKFWICKRAPAVTGEALECLGGNGYVEDSGLPRLFRDSPLNSIWEGSGNVTALDVLRALTRTPAAADAVLAEVDAAAGGDRRLDAAAGALRTELARVAEPAGQVAAQHDARRLAGLLALTLQGALLTRHAPTAVAEAFCATRLGWAGGAGVAGGAGGAGTAGGAGNDSLGPGAPFGVLPAGLALPEILARSSVPAGG
jgi:putative acyl-CoA dehydrogenase